MTAPSSFGRRQSPRVRVSFDVDVLVELAGSHARTVGGRVVVLNGGGALLELDEAFPVGSLMHVRFELPTVGTVGCRTIVRHTLGGTGVGVEFLDIEGVEQRRIVAFVTKHQADLAEQAATPLTPAPTSAQAFEALLQSVQQAGDLVETPARPGDLRRSARYVAQVPVRYRWPDETAWLNGMTANISAAGLLFALDAADPRILRADYSPPADPLRLALALGTTPALPAPASISCAARYYAPPSRLDGSSSTPSALSSTRGNSIRHRTEDEPARIRLASSFSRQAGRDVEWVRVC